MGPGSLIAGRYEIIHQLGQGGMGTVFKARDTELDRLVALKVIRPEYAGDANVLQRFKHELILARQITHRNVVRIFDLGTHEDSRFITMEFVEGRDLSDELRTRRFSPTEAARLIRQVCHALEAAHAENVIHRDLKPQNVMIDKTGRVLVMDFGLARSQALSAVTRAGAVLGTPAYMSPEQAKGQTLDARSDLFSLGVIFFELLTGTQPYQADSVWGMLLKRTQEAAPAVTSLAPEAPEALSRMVAKCLAIEPAERYQDATELALELDLWLDDTPISKLVAQRTRESAVALERAPQTPDQSGSKPATRLSWRRWGIIAVCASILVAAGVFAWSSKNPAPATAPKNETVVVADFVNRTGDPIFDGTLEPVLRLGLEGAGFISAWTRTTVPAKLESAKFDETAALRLAVAQGLGVVVAGSLEQRGSSYAASARVIRSVTGETITVASASAKDKSEVLAAVAKLAGDVRKALGDNTSEAAQRFAMDTLTATSLDAVHAYASAMDALSSGRFDQARQHFTKATDLDPKFGLAWAGMASASRSLGENEHAYKYIQLAYKNIDSMTERERYRTRGLFFVLTNDQNKCVEEYTALLAKYPSDVGARNNVGVCYSYLRNIPRAIDEMRKATEILPKRPIYRFNLALYRAYSGDFGNAEKEVRGALELNPKYEKGYLTLAYAQMGLDRVPDAVSTYKTLATLSPRSGSLAAMGLADIAIYEGRYREAIDMLQSAAREDLAANRTEAAADKFAALAHAQIALGQKPAAISSVRQALAASSSVKVKFLAGRVLAAAGETAQVRVLASSLASALKSEPQSYAKLLEAALALHERKASTAVSLATEAVKTFDTWLAHFDLGRAYFDAGAFAQADSEFEQCIKRRGEAAEIFMDDTATFAYVPPVYYWLGRVREAMNSSGTTPYTKYLTIRGSGGQDPLLADVRQKVGK